MYVGEDDFFGGVERLAEAATAPDVGAPEHEILDRDGDRVVVREGRIVRRQTRLPDLETDKNQGTDDRDQTQPLQECPPELLLHPVLTVRGASPHGSIASGSQFAEAVDSPASARRRTLTCGPRAWSAVKSFS